MGCWRKLPWLMDLIYVRVLELQFFSLIFAWTRETTVMLVGLYVFISIFLYIKKSSRYNIWILRWSFFFLDLTIKSLETPTLQEVFPTLFMILNVVMTFLNHEFMIAAKKIPIKDSLKFLPCEHREGKVKWFIYA